jgi:hypothetical protein
MTVQQRSPYAPFTIGSSKKERKKVPITVYHQRASLVNHDHVQYHHEDFHYPVHEKFVCMAVPCMTCCFIVKPRSFDVGLVIFSAETMTLAKRKQTGRATTLNELAHSVMLAVILEIIFHFIVI